MFHDWSQYITEASFSDTGYAGRVYRTINSRIAAPLSEQSITIKVRLRLLWVKLISDITRSTQWCLEPRPDLIQPAGRWQRTHRRMVNETAAEGQHSSACGTLTRIIERQSLSNIMTELIVTHAKEEITSKGQNQLLMPCPSAVRRMIGSHQARHQATRDQTDRAGYQAHRLESSSHQLVVGSWKSPLGLNTFCPGLVSA